AGGAGEGSARFTGDRRRARAAAAGAVRDGFGGSRAGGLAHRGVVRAAEHVLRRSRTAPFQRAGLEGLPSGCAGVPARLTRVPARTPGHSRDPRKAERMPMYTASATAATSASLTMSHSTESRALTIHQAM